MSLIDAVIPESRALRRVTRRAAGSRTLGEFTPGASTIALVRADVQDRAANLQRDLDGDNSQGQVDIYVTIAQLGEAFEEGDGGETPLGWTSLLIAPAEHVQGPPGDRVEFEGRVYEIISEGTFDEAGPLIDPSRRYIAEDRGAA